MAAVILEPGNDRSLTEEIAHETAKQCHCEYRKYIDHINLGV